MILSMKIIVGTHITRKLLGQCHIKNQTCQKKFASAASALLHGAGNGHVAGKRSDTVVNAVSEQQKV